MVLKIATVFFGKPIVRGQGLPASGGTRIKGKDTRKEDRGNRSEIGGQRSEDQKVRR